MRANYPETSECGRKRQPDILADRTSCEITRYILEKDPTASIDIGVLLGAGHFFVSGNVTANCNYADKIPEIIEAVLKDAGHESSDYNVVTAINGQSGEIVERANNGAGDSGVVNGYATLETGKYLPLSLVLAKELANTIDADYESGYASLGPDGKIQVTVENCNGKQIVSHVGASIQVQDNSGTGHEKVEKYIRRAIKNVLGEYYVDGKDGKTHIDVAPFGDGGPWVDKGLMSDKRGAQTYGPRVSDAGRLFTGKDGTKFDVVGLTRAREIAKRAVKSDLGDECKVQIAYFIGRDDPVKFSGRLYENGNVRYMDEDFISRHFGDLSDDLSVKNTIKEFQLDRNFSKFLEPIAEDHNIFWNQELPWEKS